MYLAREKGGRGLRSVEREYKLTKIKAAMELCQNMDPSMRVVQQFEERAVKKGHTSLMKEAHKFAEELGMSLSLEYPQPSCRSVSDPETEIQGPKANRLTEWTLDLWTTRIRRCGLWRCPLRGWSIGKRSPRRRRSSTGHCDSS